MCKISDTKLDSGKNFSHYVAYNEYGGIAMRLDRVRLEEWVRAFEYEGILAKGCWEFERASYDAIHARLAPECELDGRDTNWRSWRYTFLPED